MVWVVLWFVVGLAGAVSTVWAATLVLWLAGAALVHAFEGQGLRVLLGGLALGLLGSALGPAGAFLGVLVAVQQRASLVVFLVNAVGFLMVTRGALVGGVLVLLVPSLMAGVWQRRSL